MTPFILHPIGHVESSLKDRDQAPRQGQRDEGAPESWMVFDSAVSDGLADLRVGAEALVLTWLDRADRGVLKVHPRGDPSRPETGVFSARSPDRPNPLGLHRVGVLAIEHQPDPGGGGERLRLRVRDLEALDGTPIIDLKPVLDPISER